MILGYICTNYNNTKYTIAAINSLITEKRNPNIEIVVVDNCSDNENIELLKRIEQQYANVHIIFNNENMGYFNGLNCGIHYLRQHNENIEYIVIGNNDLVFSENFYESIISKKATLQQYAVVSPNITTLDGVYQNPQVINSISKSREIIYDIYYSNYYVAQIINKVAKITKKFTDRKDEEQYEIAQEIHQGHGSCYILGPLFFQNFDELWAPTFLMGEEFFFSVQLMEKGMKVYYEPSIKVIHHCNVSVSKMPRKQVWKLSRDAHKLCRKYIKIN
jgi:GT2 family glycosyltransferase